MIKIDGYRALATLHEGRRTQVLRGTRDVDGAPVVIKALRHEHPPLRDVARLRHEYAVLRRFDDERVVRALDFVESGPRVALILEDFGGASIRPQIPANGLDLDDFLPIACRLTEALVVVHRGGVLHKDIKPDNIIARADGERVALIDFSIASIVAEERSAGLNPDVLEGSLAYISPEQTGRMNRPIDSRSDLYSLGITLYEFLAGTTPFRAEDPLELVHAHIARPPLPLDEVRDGLPPLLSRIVARLLEKNAEDRYQSASGLLADLRRVADGHRRGELVDFPLGADDHSDRFALSTALVGREDELARLVAAFERACAGSNELVLLGGPGGIGKSALVRELGRVMVERRGAFVSGKFDALDQAAPYAALTRALRELVDELLGHPEATLAGWRARIAAAVGPNGQLVVELIPELEVLLGPQPAVPVMPAAEAANRFHAAMRAFIGALAHEDRPLALFLDDLQWADVATLKLIEDLVGDFELAHILWIGAYRDSEVSASHPLARMRATLGDAGASVSEHALAPLSCASAERIIAASVQAPVDKLGELAALIHARSEGNPFFIGALLETLHDQGVLAFDSDRELWTWTDAAVEAAALPDDVITLVSRRIDRLEPAARDLLRIAAGVGGSFELHLVARLADVDPEAALEIFWEVVRAGLVRPVGDAYKFVRDERRDVVLEFTHDRIQQAAYALLGADERVRLHVDVGRLLLAATDADVDDARLFAIAGHFRRSTALVVDPAERRRVAAMMLRASERAKAATAYHAACDFLDAGVELLPADPWRDEAALTAALARERVECEYLAGRPERAVAILEPLLVNTAEARDKAELHALRAVLETNRGDLEAAIAAGRRGLALFGQRLPKRATTASVLAAFARFQLLRGSAPPEAIMALPRMRDADRRAELRVLMSMAAAAYFVDTNLASVILLRIANRSLRYGVSDVSAYGFVGAALVMAGAFGRYEPAAALARAATELNDRFANAELAAKISLFSATFMLVWTRPMDAVKRQLREAAEVAMTNGDIIYGVYSAVTEVFLMVIDGSQLVKLEERARALMPLLRRRGLVDQIATITHLLHVFGPALQDPEGRDEGFDEDAFRASIDDTRTPLVMFYYHLYRAILCYLRGDLEGARAALAGATVRSKVAFGSAIIADLRFYECLILARVAAGERGRERRALERTIKGGVTALSRWAEGAPSSFAARATLARGELARLRRDDAQALRDYNAALALARKHHAPHIEGLAAECALRFAVERDFPVLARAYVGEALSAYRSWGALAKVTQLAEEFNAFVGDRGGSFASPTTTVPPSVMTRATSTVALDLHTVISAARTISGELAMDRLLERLATLLVENAGARRGLLLLSVNGELRVEAEATCGDAGVKVDVGLGLSPERHGAVPLAVLNRVIRTDADVVLADAIRDPLYAGDPVIRARRIRSLLCTPIRHQGALTCVLYLDNDLTVGAFTHRRLALIKQLAAQIAISLTNARLYDSLNDARIAALAADRVKTRFLMNMSHELRTPLNAILGYTELIAENVAAGDTTTLDSDLRAIHRSGVRLLRSISSILELTRIEGDPREALPVPVDLGAMLVGLLDAFRDAAAIQGNALRLDTPPPLPTLTTDEAMLRYILTTLVDNACRFTEDGTIRVRVRERTRDGAPWIEIEVTDDGVGIEEEALPRLFTAFQQGDDAPTRRFEGTGVSLAVAARFCERLGGEIAVDSQPGEGSVFTIALPREGELRPPTSDSDGSGSNDRAASGHVEAWGRHQGA